MTRLRSDATGALQVPYTRSDTFGDAVRSVEQYSRRHHASRLILADCAQRSDSQIGIPTACVALWHSEEPPATVLDLEDLDHLLGQFGHGCKVSLPWVSGLSVCELVHGVTPSCHLHVECQAASEGVLHARLTRTPFSNSVRPWGLWRRVESHRDMCDRSERPSDRQVPFPS